MAKDVRTGGRDQKQDFRRLKDEQKRQWSEHAQQWQGQGERLSGEWRRIWAEIWSTVGGAPANRVDLDNELGEALADFVARVRTEASDSRITREKLDELRATLDEAAARLSDTLTIVIRYGLRPPVQRLRL